MKDKLSKLKSVFKKYGFKETIKKMHSYAKANVGQKYSIKSSKDFNKNKDSYAKELSSILNMDYDRIIIWRSSFGWNVPLFQRPQHIMTNLSKQGCLVFYEVTTMTDQVDTIKRINERLYLVNFNNIRYTNLMMDLIKDISKPKYLEFFSTDYTLSLKDIQNYEKEGFRIIYEYIDELNPKISGTDALPINTADKYAYVIKNKDIYVIVSANILYDDIKKKRGLKNLAFASNGVDYNYYQNIDYDYIFEDNFLKVLNKPTICYYGALASWFDYELIKKISSTQQYNIVLFGAKYDDSLDKSGILKLSNVFFFGAKDYNVLKNYAYKMDVFMIPFIINDITLATSPVKLFEYMALHKPIITTNMPECAKYKSVFISNNHDEFISNITKALKKSHNKNYLQLLDREAKENDWSIKAKAIIDLIKKDEK